MDLILKGGTVLDGCGNRLPDTDVGVAGGRIAAIGPGLGDRHPGAAVLDVSGRTVMPGLVDCHLHLALGETRSAPRSWSGAGHLRTEQEAGFLETTPKAARDVAAGAYAAAKTLRAGYTTVRDLGTAAGFSDIVLREAIRCGYLVGPRILASGGGLAMTGGHGWHFGVAEADGPDAVRRLARLQLKAGADVLKIFASRAGLSLEAPGGPEFTVEEMRAICDEAHQRGKHAAAHAVGAEAIKRAVLAGVDTIEHGCLPDEECLDLMVERRTYLISTLLPYDRQARLAREAGYPAYASTRSQELMDAYPARLRRARERGVKIALGSDCGIPRLTPHGDNARELELFVRLVGASPMEAIGLATKAAAEAIGLGETVGTIEVGKQADLLAIDGDPVRDIACLQDEARVRLVLKDGRVVVRDGRLAEAG